MCFIGQDCKNLVHNFLEPVYCPAKNDMVIAECRILFEFGFFGKLNFLSKKLKLQVRKNERI